MATESGNRVIGRRTPSTRDLRVFSLLLCPFCGFVAAWLGRVGGVPRLGWWTALVIAPVSILGCFRPNAIRWIYGAWTSITTPMGRVLSCVVLGVIYAAIITPSGWCLRLVGIDPAARRRPSGVKTYWVDRAGRRDDSFFHPF